MLFIFQRKLFLASMEVYSIWYVNHNIITSIYKIMKLRFAARRVDICEPPLVTLSEAKSVRRERAYRSREDLHSATDVISLGR